MLEAGWRLLVVLGVGSLVIGSGAFLILLVGWNRLLPAGRWRLGAVLAGTAGVEVALMTFFWVGFSLSGFDGPRPGETEQSIHLKAGTAALIALLPSAALGAWLLRRAHRSERVKKERVRPRTG